MIKRIIALVGVILLVALYVATVVLALMDSDMAMNMLKAAIYATIVVPVLLWAYSMIYKLLKNHYSPEAMEQIEEARKKASNEESSATTKDE